MKKQKGLNLAKIPIVAGAFIIIAAGGVVAMSSRLNLAKQTVKQSQPAPTEPIQVAFESSRSQEIIEVKFIEGSGIRLREGKLVSLTGQDLSPFYALLNQYSVLKIERLFTSPEEKLDEMKKTGQRRTGQKLPSLNLWYRIFLTKGARSQEFINALKNLNIVEKAEPAPLPAPPPGQ